MKKIEKITVKQLISMLLNWNFGAQPASIQYITEPKLTKQGAEKFGKITRFANIGGFIGYIYESSVNNQLEREEKEKNFISKPLWNGKGKRLSTALTMHIEKGTYYLTYKYQQAFKSFNFDSSMNLIPANLLNGCFPDSKAKNQGVNEGNEVMHREISIDNIKRIKIKGVTYEITK